MPPPWYCHRLVLHVISGSDLFKRELQGLAREVEAVGIMGATTQSVVEHMDDESGLRRKIREATTAIGRSYDAVILILGSQDHLKLSGSSMATGEWRDAIVQRFMTMQRCIREARAKCIVLSVPESAARGDALSVK